MNTVTPTRTTEMARGALALQVWLSPAFPVGSFAYSHGLETAIERGDVTDAPSLRGWIDDLVQFGSLRLDAVLLAAAHRAVRQGDDAALAAVNDLALALAPSRERHLETAAQGSAFVTAARASWPCDALDRFAAMTEAAAYPVALGTAAAAHGVDLQATLEAFGISFVSNLVSAAVRLGPIGQTDGQRIIAAMVPAVAACAAFASTATLDDLGGAAMRSDIASMQHETLYSRLFRS